MTVAELMFELAKMSPELPVHIDIDVLADMYSMESIEVWTSDLDGTPLCAVISSNKNLSKI